MKENIKIPLSDIPVVPLRNTLLFPGQAIPIVVGRARSRLAVEKALRESGHILFVAQKAETLERDPTAEDLYHVGVIAKINNHHTQDNGQSYQLVVAGVARFHVENYSIKEEILVAEGNRYEDQYDADPDTLSKLVANAKQLAKDIFKYVPAHLAQFASVLDGVTDPIVLTHIIAQHLDFRLNKKQELLETVSVKGRLLILLELMASARDELKIQHEINQKVSGKLNKQQREHLLREQIRVLQSELGDGDREVSEDYAKKIADAKMPSEVEKIAHEQLARLESSNSQSPEVQVIRNYLDLLVALPWEKSATTDFSLEKAEEIINEEHFGLEKIKKRIIQHLAVQRLNPNKRGSILLFVGPPGVGKTSLARSIASAMKRQYVRVSLGGVRDDAEIRGHRRTYIGALPGRIIDGIKRAKENNPVFVLDEVDKLNRGWGGDPASALLEVLDPEQNKNFLDHYLDVPFDLSKVFFIATANSLESIPVPLLDRMEVIQLSGYTTQEKLNIGKRHLWPKQLAEHGLAADKVTFTDEMMMELITEFTREAGVRDLERQMASVLRWVSEKVVRGGSSESVKVREEDLDDILERKPLLSETAIKVHNPGVATGLAWTPLGGDILFIESQVMRGKGNLTLTGQLGEVMKESAQIAWTLLRAKLGPIRSDIHWDKIDVHLHVPAGAIPKDGPSAGVTMITSLASLLLNKPVEGLTAMTGEITLRGAVMPVGGIKEKLIAAHRAGIKQVVLPELNKRDLKDVPEEVKNSLQIKFVSNIDDLLQVTLGDAVWIPRLTVTESLFDRPANMA